MKKLNMLTVPLVILAFALARRAARRSRGLMVALSSYPLTRHRDPMGALPGWLLTTAATLTARRGPRLQQALTVSKARLSQSIARIM